PRATRTSEPPPGPMTSVSGLDTKRNGSARYQSRMLRRLSTFPSLCWAFVHASESIYKRARFGGGKPSTASIREYAFHPVCVSRRRALSCICRRIALRPGCDAEEKHPSVRYGKTDDDQSPPDHTQIDRARVQAGQLVLESELLFAPQFRHHRLALSIQLLTHRLVQLPRPVRVCIRQRRFLWRLWNTQMLTLHFATGP